MKIGTINDISRRKRFASSEVVRQLLGAMIKNRNIAYHYRKKLTLLNSSIATNNSIVRVHNRCILTSRTRGVHRKFKLSRIQIRELMREGYISGLKKSSW